MEVLLFNRSIIQIPVPSIKRGSVGTDNDKGPILISKDTDKQTKRV